MQVNHSICVQNLTYLRQGKPVIEDLSFSVAEGQCTLLLGPNGSGKTTTLNLIAGLLRPHRGNITIHGFNIHQDPMLAKRFIGFLPEHLPLYSELTVQEYLQLIAQIRKIPKEYHAIAISETLKILELMDVQHYLIGMLSKGLKQRVGLAQALLHQPSVLLLDEPSTGLDKDQTQLLIEKLLETKKTAAIILSTHHEKEFDSLCNHVIQFDKKMSGVKQYDLDHCTT